MVSPRKTAKVVLAKDVELMPLLEQIKSEHPFWGYRRIWATLRHTYSLPVNAKRVARILKKHGLSVKRPACKALRSSKTSKPRAPKPLEWWGIDMTKIPTESGWVYITLVIDWYSKVLVGFHAGYQSKAEHWLAALEMGLLNFIPQGSREARLKLMSDNGSQPTSKSFIETCKLFGIEQAFTSYNNPKGNAETERMMLTLKQELLWLHEWANLEEVQMSLSSWINWYNKEYLHSSLGYKTPYMAHQTGLTFKEDTLLNAA